MAVPQVEIDAAEAGFDPKRLASVATRMRSYVDDGRLPGWQLVVSRGGSIVLHETYGKRDIASGAPIEGDTTYRIFSMTKPITTVAAMMLYEEGVIDILDPVSKYIPAFGDTRVYLKGPGPSAMTVPQEKQMTVQHLMSHTSGLTYGFMYAHAVDHLYRLAGYEWGSPAGKSLEDNCNTWATLPLVFQPGTEWNYGVSTDVLGRVVEVASGMRLDDFVRTRITEPLGMHDTEYWAKEPERLASLYVPQPATRKAVPSPLAVDQSQRPTYLSGGGGMISTAADYHRFTQMILGGGELDGVRLLGSRTVEFMGSNHLPGGKDIAQVGRPLFSESTFEGMGFGLGFSVVLDPVAQGVPCSVGEMAWGGAASTAFWVDPVEDITCVFMTQLMPSSTWPIRPQLKRAIYTALVD